MKNMCYFILLFTPATIFAQDFNGANNENMEQMMEKMQEATTCMQNISKSDMKKMEHQSKKFEKEVQSLCAKGKRKQAENKEIYFMKKMLNDPAFSQIQKCNKIMESMAGEVTESHVCDEPQ